MSGRVHILLLAAVQALAFVTAAFSGERWAILPAAASVVLVASALWVSRGARVESHPSQRAESYREAARREEETTIVDAPQRRVLQEEYAQAKDASFGLCAGAAMCGAVGVGFAAIAWLMRDSGPLILSGGCTLAGFVLLGWWSRCRSVVRDWRDQERERDER